MNKIKTVSRLVVLLGFLVGLGAEAAMLVQFDFNGGSLTNSGTLGGVAAIVTNGVYHPVPGPGVAGQGIDNTSIAGMGTTSGRVSLPDDNNLDGLMSFTVAGWYRSDTIISNNARLVSKRTTGASPTGTAGFDLYGTTGQLALHVGNNTTGGYSSVFSGANTFTNVNDWVFFAASYDGTLAANNVVFYRGLISSGAVTVATLATGTLNYGQVGSNSGGLNIGAFNNGTAGFDGFLDSIRVYGSPTDASGVLTFAQLQQLATGDVIPEPSVLVLFSCGALSVWCVRRSRRL